MTKPLAFIGLLISANICLAASIVETATEEQLRSATCALAEMPIKNKNILLSATRNYMKKKDGINLSKAFQMDEVPFYLSTCFQIHATTTMQSRTSRRDFAHFYDQSERYMRLLLLIDVARSSGAANKTIKQMKQNAYDKITTLNLEYY